MSKKILLYFALLMWFVVPMSAQPTIFSRDTTAAPGSTITMPVYLSGFNDNLTGFQFAMTWDKDLLEYIDLKDEYIDGTSLVYASLISPSGNIRYLCYDNAVDTIIGLPFANKTLLATLTFKIIGNTGEISPLSFVADTVDNGPPFKIAFRSTMGSVDIGVENATVTIGNRVDIQDINSIGINVGQNTPNPFSDESIIPISLEKSGLVALKLFDIMGREIYAEQNFYPKGKMNLKLDSSMFESSGVYFYRIETIDYSITRKIFFKQM